MPLWNQQLFLLINAGASPNPSFVHFVTILAGSPLFAGPVLLAGLWVWGNPSARGALLAVAAAVIVGLGINVVVGHLYFEPRPFMIGLGHTWMAHAPDNAFPSDHATFTWTLGLALIMTGGARRWGAAVCVYGVAIAWARIYLGVHSPDDMAASALVALVAGWLARTCRPLITIWVLPAVEDFYESLLRVLHVPAAFVPRQ